MRKAIPVLGFLLLVAVVAAATCALTRRAMPVLHTPIESHVWIHHQLGITPQQDAALDSSESRYKEERRHLVEIIRQANLDLSHAVLEDKGASARVDSAIERIHAAQGSLQKITIEHVFEMKNVLTPAQYEKLLQLTAGALQQANTEH